MVVGESASGYLGTLVGLLLVGDGEKRLSGSMIGRGGDLRYDC